MKYTAEMLTDRQGKKIGLVDALVKCWYADLLTASNFAMTCPSYQIYDNHYVLMKIDGQQGPSHILKYSPENKQLLSHSAQFEIPCLMPGNHTKCKVYFLKKLETRKTITGEKRLNMQEFVQKKDATY